MNDMFLGGSLSNEGHQQALDTLKGRLEAAERALSLLPDLSISRQLPINGGEWLNQLAEGDITPAELPAAFQTACGSLEVARDVLKSVFESITLKHRKAGQKPAERLVFVLGGQVESQAGHDFPVGSSSGGQLSGFDDALCDL